LEGIGLFGARTPAVTVLRVAGCGRCCGTDEPPFAAALQAISGLAEDPQQKLWPPSVVLTPLLTPYTP
jgi:hypothetical protein